MAVLRIREGGVDLLEAELASGLHNTLADPSIALSNRAIVRVYLENDTDGQALVTKGERADLLRQLGGQKSAGPVDQVHSSATLLGLAVYERVGLDEVRHVGHVDANLNLAVRPGLDMNRVAKLGGAVQVEGEGLLVPVVPPLSDGSLILFGDGPVLETNAAQHGVGELIGREIVVAKKRVRLDLQVAHLAQLLNKGTEGMQGGDGPALDASHKDAVRVVLVLLDEVPRGLLGRDGDEGNALVSRLEPDNLGFLLVPAVLVPTAIPGSALGLLLLLGGLAAGTQQAEGAREHLASNTLDDGHNVTSVERLGLVADLLLLDQQETLALNLNIVVLLLRRSLPQTATATDTTLARGAVLAIGVALASIVSRARTGISDVLALLLLLLLSLLTPHLIDVKKLDGHQVSFQSAVPVLAAANEDISVQKTILGRDVGVAAVLLVDTENTRHKLPISKESRQGGLGKVRREQRLALLLLRLLAHLRGVLAALQPNHVLAVHLRGLQRLKLLDLQWGKLLLASVHASHEHLVGHLNKLGLCGVLERANGARAD